MRPEHLRHLVCPSCRKSLTLHASHGDSGGRIASGTLACGQCGRGYHIVDYIPRFVELHNYAGNFGLEWNRHARTQYDSHSGIRASEERFFNETGWPRDLAGETILEVGSGSGRFTEQAARTNAMVVSLDYSVAVEANYASNGRYDNVLIIQADVYRMPFRPEYFDRLFCFGMLQHTPDVRKAFFTLPLFIKKGGSLAVDVYRKYRGLRGLLSTKYWVRPFLRKTDPETLYAGVAHYVRNLWPLAKLIHRLPLGKQLNWALLIADYRGVYDLGEQILLDWAILDSFDMLSPTYDFPQTLATMRHWFAQAPLSDVEVKFGYNGIEGRGVKNNQLSDSSSAPKSAPCT